MHRVEIEADDGHSRFTLHMRTGLRRTTRCRYGCASGAVCAMGLYLSCGWVLLGFIGMIAGADLLVRGASGIARAIGVPPLVIGLTIVAYGTSMPEFMASVIAMRQGIDGIALGNVLGSNVCNIALVLGVAGILVPIRMETDVYRRQLPITLILTVVMAGMIATGNRIDRLEGALFVVGIVGYTYWNFTRSRDGMSVGADRDLTWFDTHRLLALGAIAVGCVLLFIGGRLTVNGSTAIAVYFNVPDRIIGATLVALGTSLPELITTVVGILRNETDLGVGNAIGSCIFNILMVVGGAALTRPISADLMDYRLEFGFCILVLVVLYPMAGQSRHLNRTHGIVLTTLYCLFIGLLCR
ncbi:calcium/sodium antiporter [bacterium]|nr:calcium/sodium antiporter [candidate division CSSED10-310 bacterium]